MATGPVIPDPFISPFGLTITPALSVHRMQMLERVDMFVQLKLTLKIKEMTFSSADTLALADDNSLKYLLSQLWLSLLDTAKEHVSDRSSWESVKSSSNTSTGEHVQVLSSSVVSAVHDGCHWQRV